MANILLEMGNADGKKWLVITLFGVIIWNLIGTPPDLLNADTVIASSLKVGHIIGGLLVLVFIWMKRHAIRV